MRGPLIILRPQPGADATAAAAAALGFETAVHPLFDVLAIDWEPPAEAFDALLFTSANAPRHGGAGLERYRALPVFAVGEATARAARAAGFTRVEAGCGDAASLVPRIAAAGQRDILHPGGAVVRPFDPGGLHITHLPVYATRPAGDAAVLASLVRPGAIAMVHSPRAGARLAALLPSETRAGLTLAAISAAALAAAGPGWAGGHAAPRPSDQALLALCDGLCQ